MNQSKTGNQRTALLFAVVFALTYAAQLSAYPGQPKRLVTITDYGAVGDGQTLNTTAIQKTIDTCSAAGGGIVRVPAGRFVTGTILIKNNVTLKLEAGAVLLGSLNPADYKNVDPFKDGLGAEVGFAMVAAVDARNVSIVGPGAIDGRGKQIAEGMPFRGEGWGGRPFLVRFVRSTNVVLRDVRLLFAAAWTANFFQTRNLTIEGLKITSYGVPHNDGINIDSSQGIRITNCDVESGDDALVFKTTSRMPTRDVTVNRCRLKSNQGAIKFGTESLANFENFRITNVHIRDTRNGGIKLLSVDGAHLQNVLISDITMDNVATPIFVRLGARLKTFRPGDTSGQVGSIRNVVIRNVNAKAAAKAQLSPPSGIFITGIPGHQIGSLRLENVTIELAGGGERDHGRQILEEKIDTYPEINRFGPRLPAFGMYARHVSGLKATNIVFKLATGDVRPALVCNDCRDSSFNSWVVPAHAGAESVVRLESVNGIHLRSFVLQGSSDTFVRVEGRDSTGIKLTGNRSPRIKNSVELAADATSASVIERK